MFNNTNTNTDKYYSDELRDNIKNVLHNAFFKTMFDKNLNYKFDLNMKRQDFIDFVIENAFDGNLEKTLCYYLSKDDMAVSELLTPDICTNVLYGIGIFKYMMTKDLQVPGMTPEKLAKQKVLLYFDNHYLLKALEEKITYVQIEFEIHKVMPDLDSSPDGVLRDINLGNAIQKLEQARSIISDVCNNLLPAINKVWSNKKVSDSVNSGLDNVKFLMSSIESFCKDGINYVENTIERKDQPTVEANDEIISIFTGKTHIDVKPHIGMKREMKREEFAKQVKYSKCENTCKAFKDTKEKLACVKPNIDFKKTAFYHALQNDFKAKLDNNRLKMFIKEFNKLKLGFDFDSNINFNLLNTKGFDYRDHVQGDKYQKRVRLNQEAKNNLESINAFYGESKNFPKSVRTYKEKFVTLYNGDRLKFLDYRVSYLPFYDEDKVYKIVMCRPHLSTGPWEGVSVNFIKHEQYFNEYLNERSVSY